MIQVSQLQFTAAAVAVSAIQRVSCSAFLTLLIYQFPVQCRSAGRTEFLLVPEFFRTVRTCDNIWIRFAARGTEPAGIAVLSFAGGTSPTSQGAYPVSDRSVSDGFPAMVTEFRSCFYLFSAMVAIHVLFLLI